MNSVELREQRAKLIADARKIIDHADAEKRELQAEESQSVDALFSDADKLESKIDTMEKRETVEIKESQLKRSERKTVPTLSRQDEAPDYAGALKSWFIRNKGGRLNGADIDNAARVGIDLSAPEINLFAPLSKRAMSKTGTNLGADLVTWTNFFGGFVDKLKYYGPTLNLVTYLDSDNGNPLPIPVMDDTANVAEILAEAGTAAAADPATDVVNLGAYKYSSKEVILSLELLQDSSFDLESYVNTALAVRFGRRWNQDITNGTGSGQPYGLTARATASGVTAGGTTSAPTLTGDDLIDLADSLDDAYRGMPGVGYMSARAVQSKVRKLKDGNGQYLWQPSLQAGVPATFNGYPWYTNPDMVSTGASKKIVLFGDYKAYNWRRVAGIEMHRLSEYRIRSGQLSWLAFARADGNLINTAAVKSIVTVAS